MNRAMRRAKIRANTPAMQVPVMFRFGQDDERRLKLMAHAAFNMLEAGNGATEHWETATVRCNWALVVATRHFKSEEVKVMQDALLALLSVRARHRRVGKWGMSGDEHKAIHAGIVLADDLQEACTRREMRDALTYVVREITRAA